jgi:hypothetical protein
MQIDTTKKTAFFFLCGVLLLLACNLSGAVAGGTPAATAGTGSTAAAGSVATATAKVAIPSDTPQPTDTPSPTATYTIVHLVTPGDTSGTTRFITDLKTKDYAAQKKAIGGDDFSTNRYERPFTAKEMVYLPDVDLTRVEMRIQSPWVYITFEFAGPRTEGIGQTMYGAEFDTNKDGRGEYLAWGASPPDGTWTTNGVEVWKDSNNDVGGPTPQITNAPWILGDGYDKNLVASGKGDDPDLAWIRQIEGGAKVQLAFKYSAIGGAPQFLWNGLADWGVRRPDWFDYNDHFTQSDAGSPLPIQADYYPLKALWGVDNTCRDAYGFTPTGGEMRLCQYYGSISGVVGWDIDHDGVLSPFELTHSMIEGDTVTLGQGACPTAGYKTAVTDSEGKYSFPNLIIGTYCVGLIHTIPVPLSIIPVTVALAPDGNKTVNFIIPW